MQDQIIHLTEEVIDNTRNDLEALIYLNLPSNHIPSNKEAERICKKMADDILEQFELTNKLENNITRETLIQSLKESTQQCSIQQLQLLELESDKLTLMEEIQMLKLKIKQSNK
jgi:hypothetical protein